MIRRLGKGLAIGLAGIVCLGAVLYAFGFRVGLGGGGRPQLQRPKSLEQQAAEIAQHRQAQRQLAGASTAAPAAAPAATPVPEASITSPAPRAAASPPYWTDFRGPGRDGLYREMPIRTDWPAAGLQPLWKQPVGAGHASFAVADDRAFTIEQRGREEVVAAYDLRSGRELWTHAWPATFNETYGGVGPRATPTWHRGTVFALGGTGELRALDAATGAMRWRTNILSDAGATNLQWGMAAAPLVVGETIVVLPGGGGGRSVMAYQRDSGKRVWSALDDQAAYSSPMLVTLAGIEQIVFFTGSRLAALSPDGSRLLWEFPWPTQTGINASQPLVIGDNRIFLSTGYGMGAALIELTREADSIRVRELWRTNRMKNQFTSSVFHDGFIYGLDEAILACIDADTGALKWKGGRYGYGQVLLASGHLVVLTEDGDVALVRATPTGHDELARFPILEGRTWNHPAMAGGLLLIRNTTEMAAFDLRAVPR